MANVWTDTNAPYVIAVAIGAVGWLVTTSVTELKQSNIVEYTMVAYAASGTSYIDVDIHNRSLSKSISSGNFTFRCRGTADTSCFGKQEPVVAARPLRGISSRSEIGISWPIYTATARLAPQSSIRYTVRTSAPGREILLLYETALADDGKSGGIVFREGTSWEGWLVENYITALLAIFAGLVATLCMWISISAFFAFRPQKDTRKDEEPPVTKMLVELKRSGDA